MPHHAAIYRPVPPLLRRLREDAGLTQRALAARLKKGQAHVYKCEAGSRRVDVAEFIEWCKACSVDSSVAISRLSKSSR
ncbi:MAG: helix-turn-helix transcriptional regulator [Proteobacteria bacterium]|nr:helix-turn-helix transcriptional regulator [Pseudomonadota bacterium]